MKRADNVHVDIDDESSQPLANKRLKKDDNIPDDDRPNQSQENDKNPFENLLILDVVFKLLPFDEVKKFRLVSFTWNDVGTSELSKRPQKPIELSSMGDSEDEGDNKLGALVQLKRSHNEVFSGDQHQLFTNFTIEIASLMSPQIDKFFENFSPRYFELFSFEDMLDIDVAVGVRNLYKSLIKIAPTVQEIKYDFEDYLQDAKITEDDVLELSSTSFPNLKKISSYLYNKNSKLKNLLFYPLIGQNSPKLRHLEFGTITERSVGSSEFMKEQFEQSRLVSKLKILSLFESEPEFNRNLINVFTEFGRKGALKLTSLKIKQERGLSPALFKDIFVPLIATQKETLKILEISTEPPYGEILEEYHFHKSPFPPLQNLSILQIDYFSTFEAFEVINFGLHYPKLVEFRTRDIRTFLIKNLGQGGDSVKSVTLMKNESEEEEGLNHFNKDRLNFDPFHQIFPNLEYLELELDHFNFHPSVPVRSQLRRVVIHCVIEDLFFIDRKLEDAKKVELVVSCGSDVTDDSYKVYLGEFTKGEVEDDQVSVSEYYNSNNTRHKYKRYQHFLDRITRNFTSLLSVSLTFIGYKIPEDLKKDLEAILPHCTFTCPPFNY